MCVCIYIYIDIDIYKQKKILHQPDNFHFVMKRIRVCGSVADISAGLRTGWTSYKHAASMTRRYSAPNAFSSPPLVHEASKTPNI